MLVAITGGRGFIGRRLVQRHLAQGDDVRVLSRVISDEDVGGAEVIVGDLTQDGDHLNKLVDLH